MTMRSLVSLISLVTSSSIALAFTVGAAQAQMTRAPKPALSVAVKVEAVAKELENPWALAFLPDGRVLVTERPGRLRIVSRDGKLSPPIPGTPMVVARNQGGLLDVALDPRFAETGIVYLTFSEPRDAGKNGTSLARARLVMANDGGRLEDVRVIFRQQPAWNSGYHFGSRIAIARDGSLFVTLGERNDARDEAQNPANHIGKVVRLDPGGTPHAGNPRLAGWAPENWSIGHRNPQSAAIHPTTGMLWTVEHGARGGDEINIPQAGKNYGWPVISYGREYSGRQIGSGTSKTEMEQPVYYWDPSIAPSGMAFYTSDVVPEWKGNLFVGSLVLTHLNRLVLDGDKVVGEERLLSDLGERIRDVRQGPDGALWLVTDNPDGRLLKVTAAR
jgi:glucose/arabinose dehydrogenase